LISIARHICDTHADCVGLQMDVDSEDDQMMQAIALSLGQNVSAAESEVECAICTETQNNAIQCFMSVLLA